MIGWNSQRIFQPLTSRLAVAWLMLCVAGGCSHATARYEASSETPRGDSTSVVKKVLAEPPAMASAPTLGIGDSTSEPQTATESNSIRSEDESAVVSDSEQESTTPTESTTPKEATVPSEATSSADAVDAPPALPVRPEKPTVLRQPRQLSDGQVFELTFDDLAFKMEKGDAFKRSLLSPEINQYNGAVIKLRGYIKPAYSQTGLTKFVFVRDNQECCFGPTAALFDNVLVKLADGVKTDFTVRPVSIEGKFYLKEYTGPDGNVWSIYRMKDSRVR